MAVIENEASAEDTGVGMKQPPPQCTVRLREAAARRGCSARQLILNSIEQAVHEDPPMVPSRGKPFTLTNQQIYDLIELIGNSQLASGRMPRRSSLKTEMFFGRETRPNRKLAQGVRRLRR